MESLESDWMVVVSSKVVETEVPMPPLFSIDLFVRTFVLIVKFYEEINKTKCYQDFPRKGFGDPPSPLPPQKSTKLIYYFIMNFYC